MDYTTELWYYLIKCNKCTLTHIFLILRQLCICCQFISNPHNFHDARCANPADHAASCTTFALCNTKTFFPSKKLCKTRWFHPVLHNILHADFIFFAKSCANRETQSFPCTTTTAKSCAETVLSHSYAQLCSLHPFTACNIPLSPG